MMAIRLVCFALVLFVTPYSWYTWVFAAMAIFLPYVAVVVANVSADRKAPTAMAPERALGPQRMPAPAEPVVPATGVIRIQESPRRDDDRSR